MIDFEKKELDPKLLITVMEAAKTAFDHQIVVTKATLKNGSMSKPEWRFGDDKVSIRTELKTGEVISIENQQGRNYSISTLQDLKLVPKN